ncbi:tyrosine-type recombinase/integrase [Nocardioides sp. R-C-SC26]|uniref:tyrosine-type recombinase/integrase n=1 Tax=Nocardioides sp. R-C-SC26 TaxID=2870414 RepID=UPI001E5A28EF|nr:tyrosine-type recombinase/integrase [Nocardioides sp. R-C-SC26]
MPVRRGNKWEARLKINGLVVQTKRFDTKREAAAWEYEARGKHRESGFNPARGKKPVEVVLISYLEDRVGRVSPTTLANDRFLLPTQGQLTGKSGTQPLLPIWLRKLNVGDVTSGHVKRWQDSLLARGLAPTSVKRHRESLSSFFAWCVEQGYAAANPVKGAAPPKDRRPTEQMRPLPEPELDEVVAEVARRSPGYADLIVVLARTGIRWGECRALRVQDFTEVPMPMLWVGRNQPEGVPTAKATKSGLGRRVPLSNAVLPAVRRFAAGKAPDSLLFTRPGGGQLHRSMLVRQTSWTKVGRGRTLHDLRHTAACLWLMSGVPLGTVQAWLGHSTIAMTSRYLHHLGDYADRAALELLNGTRGSGAKADDEETG